MLRRWFRAFIPSLEPRRQTFWPTPFGNNCARLYEEALDRGRAHHRRSKRWSRLHYLLGLGTVTLAAAAGFGGLQDLFGKEAAAYVALAAAVVAAIWTFLRTAEQQKVHDEMANAWDNFRETVATMYSTHVGYAPEEQLAHDWQRRSHEAGAAPGDPADWQSLIGALQEEARKLRKGQT